MNGEREIKRRKKRLYWWGNWRYYITGKVVKFMAVKCS
jgi:hypothetical protein